MGGRKASKSKGSSATHAKDQRNKSNKSDDTVATQQLDVSTGPSSWTITFLACAVALPYMPSLRHAFVGKQDFLHYDDVQKVGDYTTFRSAHHNFPHHNLHEGGKKEAFARRAQRLGTLMQTGSDEQITPKPKLVGLLQDFNIGIATIHICMLQTKNPPQSSELDGVQFLQHVWV